MLRLLAIGLLVFLAYFLIRYRSNVKVQKVIISSLLLCLALYVISLVTLELFR